MSYVAAVVLVIVIPAIASTVSLIQNRKPFYNQCSYQSKVLHMNEKQRVSIAFVAAIREGGGRFLHPRRENDKDKTAAGMTTWFEIDDKKAIEKKSQALREKVPIRIRLI